LRLVELAVLRGLPSGVDALPLDAMGICEEPLGAGDADRDRFASSDESADARDCRIDSESSSFGDDSAGEGRELTDSDAGIEAVVVARGST
jgi:hypothetical protein